MVACMKCGRPLSDPKSIKIGFGPECRKQLEAETARALEESNPVLGPFEGDVVLCRVDGKPGTNVPWILKLHSPTGMEWGYGGSGPADLALNILNQFLPAGCDGYPPIKRPGGLCSDIADRLYQNFKWDFIAPMDKDCGGIRQETIRDWLLKMEVPAELIRIFKSGQPCPGGSHGKKI